MAWKTYFWILAALLAVKYAAILPMQAAVYQYFDHPTPIVALAGLFGYAYKKQIIHANFWKIWFFLVLAWEAVYTIFLADWTVIEKHGLAVALAAKLLSFAIIAPGYVALYLYGFRSRELWESSE